MVLTYAKMKKKLWKQRTYFAGNEKQRYKQQENFKLYIHIPFFLSWNLFGTKDTLLDLSQMSM